MSANPTQTQAAMASQIGTTSPIGEPSSAASVPLPTPDVSATAASPDLGSTITRTTFVPAAEALEALLPTAEFVAIDCEMTGINLVGSRPFQTDTTQQRYDKMRRVASTYSLMQVGVCTFHRAPAAGDAEDGVPASGSPLVARPFNFSVAPSLAAGSKRVTVDMSTCVFLRSNKMDFNAWVDGGVPGTCSQAVRTQHSRTARRNISYRHSAIPQCSRARSSRKRRRRCASVRRTVSRGRRHARRRRRPAAEVRM